MLKYNKLLRQTIFLTRRSSSSSKNTYPNWNEDKVEVINKKITQLGNLFAIHFFITHAIYVPIFLIKL
jgi:hypothetical protein